MNIKEKFPFFSLFMIDDIFIKQTKITLKSLTLRHVTQKWKLSYWSVKSLDDDDFELFRFSWFFLCYSWYIKNLNLFSEEKKETLKKVENFTLRTGKCKNKNGNLHKSKSWVNMKWIKTEVFEFFIAKHHRKWEIEFFISEIDFSSLLIKKNILVFENVNN